jgi:hypothetical protein
MGNAAIALSILSSCQVMMHTNDATAIAINGLAEFVLETDKTLPTLVQPNLMIGGAVARQHCRSS